MQKIRCQVKSCYHVFTDKRGLKSHFVFTHGLPAFSNEYQETKREMEKMGEIDPDTEKSGKQSHNERKNIIAGKGGENSTYFQNGDDLIIKCRLCGETAILQRNKGPNNVICDFCGAYELPNSG